MDARWKDKDAEQQRGQDSRLVDGNENEVLLEQIHVPSPRLHPVVLPSVDSGDSEATLKRPIVAVEPAGTGTGGELTAGWLHLPRSCAPSGSASCRRRS